jgi:hypothetical protein
MKIDALEAQLKKLHQALESLVGSRKGGSLLKLVAHMQCFFSW